MPAESIAQNLAFINWTMLTGLALGSYAVVALARSRTAATRGFLIFTTVCAVFFGLLAWLSDGALPAATLGGSPIAADPTWETPRRAALAVFCLLVFVELVVRRLGGPGPVVAAGALASGVLVLVFGALSWGGDLLGAVPLLLQLTVLTAATGGVFAAMILGHWYLVTPKLPAEPLILVSRSLLAVVVLQLVLFAAWIATGAGPTGGDPFSALVGPWALFVWLRLVVGLVFPLIVSWAAVQTARSRSMESATGLLYINVGSIAAGTILASGLYFGAGLLV
jgi:hypothetical protein